MMEGGQETARVWSGSIFSPILVSLDGAHPPILPPHSTHHTPLLCSQAHVPICCKNRRDLLSQREVVPTKGPFIVSSLLLDTNILANARILALLTGVCLDGESPRN